jgi:hypothetical protein
MVRTLTQPVSWRLLRLAAVVCAFGWAATLGACDEHERGEGDDEGPLVCEREDREGSYLLSFAIMKGDCGHFADQRVNVEDVEALPAGCKLDHPDEWVDNDCKLRRYYTCVTDLGTSKWTSVTEQHDEGATVLSGVVTVKLTGEQPCMGTYGVRYARQ